MISPKPIKTVCLITSFLLFSSSAVVAAEGDELAGIDGETAVESRPTAANQHTMMRENSDVDGYQPLTIATQVIEASYLEETIGDNYGIIVFLHDRGDKFENQVTTPLRHNLLDYGWSTMSIALNYPYEPNLYLYDAKEVARQAAADKTVNAAIEAENAPEKEAAWDDEPEEEIEELEELEEEVPEPEIEVLPPIENSERIEAVLEFIVEKEADKIIFVAHGAGGNLAVELLETIQIPIDALILVNTAALETDEVWETFAFPILDIYGSNDAAVVEKAIKHRKKIMKISQNSNYQLREVMGANHVFYGMTDQLTLVIRSWLNKRFIEQEEE